MWVTQPLVFTVILLSCRGYLITAPSVFRSGVEEVISVTIFNSPREVMVQAQLVAQGEAVARNQGAILGRSLGCLTGASSPFAQWSHFLTRGSSRVGTALPPPTIPLQNPGRGGRAGGVLPVSQMKGVRPRRGSHMPSLGNQSALFLGSPGSIGTNLDGVRHPSVSALAGSGTGTWTEPCDHIRPFVELSVLLWF